MCCLYHCSQSFHFSIYILHKRTEVAVVVDGAEDAAVTTAGEWARRTGSYRKTKRNETTNNKTKEMQSEYEQASITTAINNNNYNESITTEIRTANTPIRC